MQSSYRSERARWRRQPTRLLTLVAHDAPPASIVTSVFSYFQSLVAHRAPFALTSASRASRASAFDTELQ